MTTIFYHKQIPLKAFNIIGDGNCYFRAISLLQEQESAGLFEIDYVNEYVTEEIIY
jgi:hypothetical protein